MKKTLIKPSQPKRLLDVLNQLDRIENMDFLGLAAVNDGNVPSGKIHAYNDAVGDTHYSEALTGYAVGWRDPENLDALLEEYYPDEPPIGPNWEYAPDRVYPANDPEVPPRYATWSERDWPNRDNSRAAPVSPLAKKK